MSDISKSPARDGYQLERYINRCKEKGEPIRDDYVEMYKHMDELRNGREHSPEFTKNNLEYDLRSTDWVLKKVRDNKIYAQHLYAALCNNDFQKNDTWPILKDSRWSCSWRYAGGIIADMRQEGDYLDWYCSGMQGMEDDSAYIALNNQTRNVGEGDVTDEIKEDLFTLGWLVVTDNEEK